MRDYGKRDKNREGCVIKQYMVLGILSNGGGGGGGDSNVMV